MDFLFVLIDLFSLGVTAEAIRADIDWKSSTNHSSCQKTTWIVLLYGIRILAEVSNLFIKVHAFDRQTGRRTDGQTDISVTDMTILHRCSAVEIVLYCTDVRENVALRIQQISYRQNIHPLCRNSRSSSATVTLDFLFRTDRLTIEYIWQ